MLSLYWPVLPELWILHETKPISTGENKVTAQHLGSPGSSLPKAWVLGLLFLCVIKLHLPLLPDTWP